MKKNIWKFIYGLMFATSPIMGQAYFNGLVMRASGLKSEFLDEIERHTL